MDKCTTPSTFDKYAYTLDDRRSYIAAKLAKRKYADQLAATLTYLDLLSLPSDSHGPPSVDDFPWPMFEHLPPANTPVKKKIIDMGFSTINFHVIYADAMILTILASD